MKSEYILIQYYNSSLITVITFDEPFERYVVERLHMVGVAYTPRVNCKVQKNKEDMYYRQSHTIPSRYH